MNLKRFVDSILGNNSKTRFKRLIVLFLIVAISLMLFLNLGYDKSKGGFYWKPAAEITINKNL